MENTKIRAGSAAKTPHAAVACSPTAWNPCGTAAPSCESCAAVIMPAGPVPTTRTYSDAAAAASLASTLGISPEGLRAGLKGFKGLPHRLELVEPERPVLEPLFPTGGPRARRPRECGGPPRTLDSRRR